MIRDEDPQSPKIGNLSEDLRTNWGGSLVLAVVLVSGSLPCVSDLCIVTTWFCFQLAKKLFATLTSDSQLCGRSSTTSCVVVRRWRRFLLRKSVVPSFDSGSKFLSSCAQHESTTDSLSAFDFLPQPN